MQLLTCIECSLGFLSQEIGTDTFSSSRAKFQQFFIISISLARVAFSFSQSWKRLLADCLRCEHRRFNMTTSEGLVSYILADLGPHGDLLTKQTSFLVQQYMWLARIALRKFASLYLPATISLASPTKRMYACNTRPFSNSMPPNQLRTN